MASVITARSGNHVNRQLMQAGNPGLKTYNQPAPEMDGNCCLLPTPLSLCYYSSPCFWPCVCCMGVGEDSQRQRFALLQIGDYDIAPCFLMAVAH